VIEIHIFNQKNGQLTFDYARMRRFCSPYSKFADSADFHAARKLDISSIRPAGRRAGVEHERTAKRDTDDSPQWFSTQGLPMTTAFFELCAETREAALAAEAGGADRIELCSELARGGLTPDAKLTERCAEALSIPIYVLIRPRSGSFVFSAEEFRRMREQIAEAQQAGAGGVAVGALLADGRVDLERTGELVELARPMAATFHRAFDETPDLSEALEQVIAAGAQGLLTSGGAKEVLGGAERIAALLTQANGRIDVIAGGGLKLETLAEVVRRSGASALHGSLQRRNGHGNGTRGAELEADVREAVRLLRSALEERMNGEPGNGGHIAQGYNGSRG
jgi:copper homeostasis protein